MDDRVPYAALERARKAACKKFPNATRVVALWTPAGQTETCVEVWHGERATVARFHEARA